jgi:hypothetical protein
VTRCNRIDPWGDLHADPARGLFTGNRGPLVDDARRIVRHHSSTTLWITCALRFRDWRHPLDQPHIWTPLFFLDDAVALAAGHRPCATCRRDAFRSYRDSLTAALGRERYVLASEMNSRLNHERLRRGRGLDRGSDRRIWTTTFGDLPDGTIVVGETGEARLVRGDHTWMFSFDGWCQPRPRAHGSTVDVITPPTSVEALRHGFEPIIHPSATT